MKKQTIISASSLVFIFTACSTNQIYEDRAPASDLARYEVPNVSLQLETQVIQYCGLNFDSLEVSSSHPGVLVYQKMVTNKKLPFAYPVPAAIGVTHPSTATVLSKAKRTAVDLVVNQIQLKNPIFPSIPILPQENEKEVCPKLVKYHQQFQKIMKAGQIRSSKILNLNRGLATLNLPELSKQIIAESSKVEKLAQQSIPPVSPREVNFLIFYDDEYESDVEKLSNAHDQLGYKPMMLKISQLPGYQANDPIPAECAGEYLSECYHVYGAPTVGVSQNAVAATKGIVNHLPISQGYSKLPYVPGLIRAATRAYQKQFNLKGILLVGNPEKIPGFYTIMDAHGSFPYSYEHEEENNFNKLHTDLYYMIPELVLKPNGKFSHEVINPGLWMCQNGATGVRTYRYWCNNDEARAWPNPPLSVLKWSASAAGSRVLQMKNSEWSAAVLGEEDLQNIQLNDIIPVGRIVTHENLTGVHDEVVNNYAKKMLRWNHELPSMTGNSIQSNGGSTGDSWIFLDADLTQFRATYGNNSAIYSSEFFVSIPKCQGFCQYKSAELIQEELRAKNRVAFHLNGHGGHVAVQGPYANGNIFSGFTSEYYWGSNQYNQLVLTKYPETNTIKPLENGGLVGHIFANSCSLSNFNLENSWNKMMHNRDPQHNVKSIGEQWLDIKNGGAMNVYTNSDVGWGYSDNNYNVKFMSKVALAHSQCGTIGDAVKLTVYDMIQGLQGGAGDWQVVNRQFLGSPANRIARLPYHCLRTVPADHLEARGE